MLLAVLSLALYGAIGQVAADGDGCQSPVTAEMLTAGYGQIGSAAEWQQAQTVVVHTPGDEIFSGLPILPRRCLSAPSPLKAPVGSIRPLSV
jgi:hypothetical protein